MNTSVGLGGIGTMALSRTFRTAAVHLMMGDDQIPRP
jgi:hypothetical protein